MMENATLALRKELHSIIDNLPERKLNALRPLFDVLVDDDNIVAIETDLTEEELVLIREGDKHYKEHPEDFVPLESLMK